MSVLLATLNHARGAEVCAARAAQARELRAIRALARPNHYHPGDCVCPPSCPGGIDACTCRGCDACAPCTLASCGPRPAWEYPATGLLTASHIARMAHRARVAWVRAESAWVRS